MPSLPRCFICGRWNDPTGGPEAHSGGCPETGKTYIGAPCALQDDWRSWDADKRADRQFMSCPGCGKYGSHVGEK
jgi:hypothetical protein